MSNIKTEEYPIELSYYRKDPYLDFLGGVSSEDLEPLVEIITSTSTEELTLRESYQKFYPDHKQYWKDIAAEIQTFGGNTFANLVRGGEGVLYEEILRDVCKKFKIKDVKNKHVIDLEKELLEKVIVRTLLKISLQEIKEIVNELKSEKDQEVDEIIAHIDKLLSSGEIKCPKWLATMIAQVVIKKIGFWAINKVVLTFVNWIAKILLGRGLSLVVNKTISTILGRGYTLITGPWGWLITITWSLIDIAGPAYRVTIPCCVYIAFLRRKYQFYDKAEFISTFKKGLTK